MPETMTKNEMMRRYLEQMLDRADERFKEAKENFLERASADPANAISWGESMIMAQAEHMAADTIRRSYAKRLTDFREENNLDNNNQIDDEDKLNILMDAIDAYVERETEFILNGHYAPTSSSMLSNGVDVAKQKGLSTYVRNLRDNVRAARPRIES